MPVQTTNESPLAGPRRTRTSAVPPPLPKVIAPTPPSVPIASLDYEEMPSDRSVLPTKPTWNDTTAKVARKTSRKMHWFAIGLALGAVVAATSTGDLGAHVRHAREHLASQIRAMKKHTPERVAPAAAATALATTADVPCTEEDCAVLLAPFKAASFAQPAGTSVPLVDVNELPRVRPRTVAPPARATSVEAAGTAAPSDDPPSEPAATPASKDEPVAAMN